MIHVENLTKYYGDFCAVDKINLTINKGEILGLLGPNGAGKTTTLRMLTGFFKPSSGDIKIKEKSIIDSALEIKSSMGYLPESAPIYQDMLVYDYLDYIADLRGMDSYTKTNRIKELSELCGLSEIMHKDIRELSKGLKQRVGLAYAMMSDPEILILDEPTSGLDPNQIVEIRNIIKRIGKEKTIIFSTHILSEAEATCDRIVIINNGVIAADGTTEEIVNSSDQKQSVYLDLLNADFTDVSKALNTIFGVSGVAKLNGSDESLKIKVNISSKEDLRAQIYETVKNTDWILVELRRETKTLEKIFHKFTREN
ncbi:MAG: ATP-binding cassette domain-containing protein [Desulfobacterales bacterium]|nr:ATP-binding cassette domain-containing protein [Desulfobacterales bacterium]MCP4163601.1 ATP-binding cassette domain-containing protein [Deltaproteobacteria bacterium]